MTTSLLAYDYGKVLFEEKIERESVEKAVEILNIKEVSAALDSPAIDNREKHRVIDRLFNSDIRNFVKYISDNRHIYMINDIYNVYDSIALDNDNSIKAEFYCVTPPDERQLKGIENMVKKKYGKDNVVIDIIEDKGLIGGFILKVGDFEYDRSIKNSLNNIVNKLEWR